MKNRILTKIIATSLIVASLIAVNPIGASAEWKENTTGWWYQDGNSWYTGWKEISGKWYYFDGNGYMAHDKTINGYKLGTDGAWIDTTTTNTNNTSGVYYWGKDLKHMNYQTSSGPYDFLDYSSPGEKNTIHDNLNNEYKNYLKLEQYVGEDTYSYVEFPLNGQYKEFKSLLGLTKDHQDSLSSCDVKIYLDDKEVYSQSLGAGDMLKNVDLELTGKNKIKFYLGNAKPAKEHTWTEAEIGFFNGQFIK